MQTSDVFHKEWFCTEANEHGRYYLAIEAADVLDPSGPVPGFVMHDGSHPGNAELVPNPGRDSNSVKHARGYYVLRVAHRTFQDGPLLPGESREGCISYNQWRTFSVVTTDASDASLHLSVSGLTLSSRGEQSQKNVSECSVLTVHVRGV